MSANHVMAALTRAAVAKGWNVTRTSKNHLCFKGYGAIVIASGTPGDQRVPRNTQARLSRAERNWRTKR